jgi:hypothetical protein
MSIVAPFTVAKIHSQPKGSSTDEKRKNVVMCTYTVEYYSVLKEKEILLFATKWMNLEDIMLREIS